MEGPTPGANLPFVQTSGQPTGRRLETMTTSDREPQYLGTHKGVSRVQVGWTTLYFTGDAYTHAIGNLYGTHEQPAREEITAARKAIPIKPRPPTMAHAPGEERKPSRPRDKGRKPAAKPSPTAKKAP